MTRWTVRICLLVAGLGTVAGCQGPRLTYVPWYRGIPANFLAKNSLEAEVWRQQRTGIVEGWPLPPEPVVPDPIPLAPKKGESSTGDPNSQDADSQEDQDLSSRRQALE